MARTSNDFDQWARLYQEMKIRTVSKRNWSQELTAWNMELGIIVESCGPECVWNGFRMANKALENGHSVRAFLLGEGVEAPDVTTDKFNPSGVMRKFLNEGGELYACGTCLDSRNMEPDELRPRSTMGDLLEIVEETDKTITIG